MKECYIPKFFEILGKKWVLAIIKIIAEEEGISFNELKNKLGITPKILSLRLQLLEEEGYIEKKESTFKHSFKLTKEAKQLKDSFANIIPILEKIKKRAKNK